MKRKYSAIPKDPRHSSRSPSQLETTASDRPRAQSLQHRGNVRMQTPGRPAGARRGSHRRLVAACRALRGREPGSPWPFLGPGRAHQRGPCRGSSGPLEAALPARGGPVRVERRYAPAASGICGARARSRGRDQPPPGARRAPRPLWGGLAARVGGRGTMSVARRASGRGPGQLLPRSPIRPRTQRGTNHPLLSRLLPNDAKQPPILPDGFMWYPP